MRNKGSHSFQNDVIIYYKADSVDTAFGREKSRVSVFVIALKVFITVLTCITDWTCHTDARNILKFVQIYTILGGICLEYISLILGKVCKLWRISRKKRNLAKKFMSVRRRVYFPGGCFFAFKASFGKFAFKCYCSGLDAIKKHPKLIRSENPWLVNDK